MLTSQQALNRAFAKKSFNLIGDPANKPSYQLLAAGNSYQGNWLETKGWLASVTLFFYFNQAVNSGDVHLLTLSSDVLSGDIPAPSSSNPQTSKILTYGLGSQVNTVFWLNGYSPMLLLNSARHIRFDVRNLFDQDIYIALAWTHSGD